MTGTDYEARFLELASRPGMENLQQVCPTNCIYAADWVKTQYPCRLCQGRGWCPLPEAERLGALVGVALDVSFHWWPEEAGGDYWEALIGIQAHGKTGPTPEAALVEALLATTENE